MRVLVTGGAGFIGSHVVDELVSRGVEVAALDDLSTGRRENLPPSVRLYECDIRDRGAVERALSDFHPARVVHLAAQASVKASVDDPVLDATVNVIGGLHLLEAARASKVEGFVFASTGGAIYGEVPPGTRADEHAPARPKSPYAASKAAFEHYLSVYRQTHGLRVVVLRYANVYGPRQDPHGEAGVVAIFARRILRGEPVTLYARRRIGDEGCVRDYVHVRDVARANHLALSISDDAGAFNVSTGIGTTTREVLDAIARAAKATPRVVESGPRAGDLEASCLDPGRLMARGWRPEVPFDEGIRETVEWFAKH